MNGLFASLFEQRFHVSQSPPGWIVKNYGMETSAGIDISEEGALNATAVMACVRILAESVASLPLITYRRLADGGKGRAINHSLYRILHDAPNPEMTSFQWRETMMGHLCLWGNAYSEIVTDQAGRVKELWPLRPDRMRVARENDELKYYYKIKATSPEEPLPAERILHIPGISMDGVKGISLITAARNAIGLAMATEEFGATFFRNGATPGIVLRHPGTLGEVAYKRLKESWNKEHQGQDRHHRTAILEEGISVEKIGIPPEDAQFLQTRRFQVEEIARIFRVPPHMLADLERATFSNIEHQGLEFVIHSLRPWLVRLEQGYKRKLLMPREQVEYYIEHLVDGLLRGDLLSRYQAYAVGRVNGWLSADDVLEMENRNPLPNGKGKIYLMPMNMIPVEGRTSKPMERETRLGQTGRDLSAEHAENAEGEIALAEAPLITAGRLAMIEVEERATRAARSRHRLMNTYRRLYKDQSARILRREANDVRAAAGKMLKMRDTGSFMVWLRQFYAEHKSFVSKNLASTMHSYADLIIAEVERELEKGKREQGPGTRVQGNEVDLQHFVQSYLETYSGRHAGMSEERLIQALQRAMEQGDDLYEAIEDELEGWDTVRAEQIGNEEAVRSNNAFAVAAYGTMGVNYIRSVAFGKNCPYCDSLDGKVIGIEQYYLHEGEEFKPEGSDGMKVSRNMRHSPYHDGCDCMNVAG